MPKSVRPITYFGMPHAPTWREDIDGLGCTICLTTISGGGVDAGPVDMVCKGCAEAIHDVIDKRDHPDEYEEAPVIPEQPTPQPEAAPTESAPDVTPVTPTAEPEPEPKPKPRPTVVKKATTKKTTKKKK